MFPSEEGIETASQLIGFAKGITGESRPGAAIEVLGMANTVEEGFILNQGLFDEEKLIGMYNLVHGSPGVLDLASNQINFKKYGVK